MRTLTTLLALLRGRITGGYRKFSLRGREYAILPTMAGADDGGGEGGGEGGDGGSGEPAGGDEGSEGGKDPEVVKAYAKLREAEDRAKAAEKTAQETAARLKKIEDADKSELQKAQDRLKELEDQAGASVSMYQQAQLVAELAKPEHGITNAKAAAKLIEGVEFNDSHEPQGVADAVKALREEVPGLFGEGKAPADGGSPANPARSGGKELPVEPGYGRLARAYSQK